MTKENENVLKTKVLGLEFPVFQSVNKINFCKLKTNRKEDAHA